MTGKNPQGHGEAARPQSREEQISDGSKDSPTNGGRQVRRVEEGGQSGAGPRPSGRHVERQHRVAGPSGQEGHDD